MDPLDNDAIYIQDIIEEMKKKNIKDARDILRDFDLKILDEIIQNTLIDEHNKEKAIVKKKNKKKIATNNSKDIEESSNSNKNKIKEDEESLEDVIGLVKKKKGKSKVKSESIDMYRGHTVF
jgi:ABC-type proline/glycine betaine transport system ATPase subunit